MDVIDAERQGEVVEVDVAGLGDGDVQVDGAVPGALPVAVFALVARQGVEARAVGAGVVAGDALFQAGQAHERLDGGAGRILSAQGAVEQRLVVIVLQRGVGAVVDAVDERVRVIGRQADEGEHVAVLRVDGNRRAAEIAERAPRRRAARASRASGRGCGRIPAPCG